MSEEPAKRSSRDAPRRQNPPRRLRPSQVVSRLVLGVVIGLVLTMAVIVYLNRDRRERLSTADLDAAVALWKRRAISGYNLDLETFGTHSQRIHVEVREGQPKECTIDGRRPIQRRVWDSWTVPRLFDYIREDLRRARLSRGLQRAEFDTEYGYPRNYRFTEPGGQVDIGWRVTRFEPRGG